MNTDNQMQNEAVTDSFKKRSSIRTKVIVAVVLASFVTVSLTTGFQIRTICRSVLSEAQMQAAALTIPVKEKIDSLLDSGSGRGDFGQLAHSGPNIQIRRLLGEAVAWSGRTDLTAAYVIDDKGKVLASAGKARMVKNVPSEIFESKVKGIREARIVGNGSRYDTFVPYYGSAEQVSGYLVIGISAQSLWDRATDLASGAVISFSIIAVITVAVLALWVSHFMVHPLEKITKRIAQGASNEKQYLKELTKSGDEIAHLAEVTDQVLPELYRQQEQLKTTQQQLTAENAKLERTKQALLKMEQYYRAAVEAATGVAYELDLATGKFKFLSRQVYETVGFAAEDLPSSDVWSEHIHEDDRAQAKEALSACVEGKKSCFSRRYRFVCRDGQSLEVVELGGLITDEAGRSSLVSGIIIPAYMLPKSLLASR